MVDAPGLQCVPCALASLLLGSSDRPYRMGTLAETAAVPLLVAVTNNCVCSLQCSFALCMRFWALWLQYAVSGGSIVVYVPFSAFQESVLHCVPR